METIIRNAVAVAIENINKETVCYIKAVRKSDGHKTILTNIVVKNENKAVKECISASNKLINECGWTISKLFVVAEDDDLNEKIVFEHIF